VSNGSEHIPEKQSFTIKSDRGPGVRIVNHVENVPVRWGFRGPVIGSSTVSDNGEIQITLDDTTAAREIYTFLNTGVSDSFSIEHNPIKKEQEDV